MKCKISQRLNSTSITYTTITKDGGFYNWVYVILSDTILSSLLGHIPFVLYWQEVLQKGERDQCDICNRYLSHKTLITIYITHLCSFIFVKKWKIFNMHFDYLMAIFKYNIRKKVCAFTSIILPLHISRNSKLLFSFLFKKYMFFLFSKLYT